MQTRRDQLHAYRFQNRRALAALVTGEPNVVEPPMRRLTITTVSGIMIAVLVTVGFTLFGLIRPKAGDAWKKPGSIIVEDRTGTTFVYLEGKLRPVANYTSAVLAVGNNPTTIHVEDDDIAGTEQGSLIGIPGLPATLPDAGDLVSSPVTACSRQQAVDGQDQLSARTSIVLGGDAGSRTLAAAKSVVVDTGPGTQNYLLFDGHRLEIDTPQVETTLGLASAPTLRVGGAFLDAVPAGTPLRTPTLPDQGDPAGIPGLNARVGQLLKVDGDQYFVALSDGVAAVNPVERALLQTMQIGPGDRTLDPIEATVRDTLGNESARWPSIQADQFARLPTALPQVDPGASANGAVCAVFRDDSGTPVFAVPPSLLPAYRSPDIGESTASTQGLADEVDLPPGSAAVVRATDAGPTAFLVGGTGKKFAVPTTETLGSFGYDTSDEIKLPAQLLALIPTGPALNADDARRPVS